MKRPALLLPLLLATLTALMQLPRMVAHSRDLTSEVAVPDTVEEAHAVAQPTAVKPLPRISLAASRTRTPSSAKNDLSVFDQPDLEPRHRRLALQVYRLFPTTCRQKLKSFSVLYKNPQHRGLAGKGVVIVSGIVADSEYLGLLTHEMAGHFWDITCITGTKASGASAFKDGATPVYNDDPSVGFYGISWQTSDKRKPTAHEEDFVTGYASSKDPFEDLAESVSYFLLQPELFASRAQTNPALAAKLAWLQEHFPTTTRVAIGTDTTPGIAWDATKLSYRWLGL